ncbi:protein translocase subunit SecD [Streptomyces apocyni]|uniref:protein translocase subunit SecD n=1 Tax=Streptomyces apocyni TaxID=2654677 RepID=UPI0012EB01E5|nr:protein translocase subunit SecD [Streptomyces apocyni]
MAAPKKGRRQSGQARPGRALALILIAMVALTGGMFLSGHTTPRLGIDLAGGTSITLEAKAEPGRESAINETNMNTAVDIIDRRVNGLGVSEAEVKTQGNKNIIVNVPKGTDEEQAREQVGTTAQLYFRPVITLAPGGPTPDPAASPSETPKADDKDAKDDGKKDDKDAKDEASDPSASPSPTATTQGRAVTDALKADDDPSPSADASDKPKASDSPMPDPSADAETAALQKKFTELDCTKPAQRTKAAEGTKPTDTIVACGKNAAEQWEKYILGPAEVEGTDVKEAKGQLDPQQGIWKVTMDFTGKGSKKFASITSKLSQQQPPQNQFAIVLDNNVVSAPSVRTTLSKNAEITGSFNQESAQNLANILSYGALPLSFEEVNVLTISPSLGGEQLKTGLIAGVIGLLLVVAYLVFYYRALALVAVASLALMGGLTYVIMSLMGPAVGFALSLPAVCGAIVAIGITADSFIVYFERIRDEVRGGRSIRPAIERAWPTARRTILVSDVVSFLAAVVLFFAAVGTVQGFAFVLGLTTLLDVVVVFGLTKPMTTLLARRKFFYDGHPMSGLDPKRLGATPPIRGRRRAAAPSAEPKEA